MISLIRIDDRLIHGQVCTQWLHYSRAKKILIIDDATAKDMFMSKMLTKMAPLGTTVEVLTCEDSISRLKELLETFNDNIMILTKGPSPILNMIENEIHVENVIVGGMGKNGERSTLYKNISASQAERDCFKKIIDKGVKVYLQVLPSDKQVDIDSYL